MTSPLETAPWGELELELLLVDTERREQDGVAAHRDPRRPLVWDRQLAVVKARVGEPERVVERLAPWYAEGRAARWSVVVTRPGEFALWDRIMSAQAAEREELVLLEGPVRREALARGVRVRGGDEALLVLSLFRARALDEEGKDFPDLPAQLSSALRLRTSLGAAFEVLSFDTGDEVHGVIVLTCLGKRAWLDDLEVLPTRRGLGLGRKLYAAGLARAGALGAGRVGLSAFARDWPAAWYLRTGCREVGRVVRHKLATGS